MLYELSTNKVILRAVTVSLVASLLQAEGAQGPSEASNVTEMALAAPADEYTLEYAQNAFVRFYKAEQYNEATDAGKLVIKLLLVQEDIDIQQWSLALAQLASAQRKDGQFDVAIQNYTAAIELLEADSDPLNERLVDPLWGLSRTYVDAAQLDTALAMYQRALHVKQVNGGLHNVEQSGILVEMSEIWFKRGEYSKADALQRFNVNLAKHEYPGDNLLKLPAMYGRADMLHQSDENLKSQRLYREILQLVQSAEGPKALTLLPVLHKLSDKSLYDVTNVKFSAEYRISHYLRRAVKIAEQHVDATNLQKADAHLAMADFIILNTGNRTRALRSYRKAWDSLSGDDALRAERDKRFGEPVALNDLPTYRIAAFWGLKENPGDTDKDGFVVLTYDVTRKGKIENMRVAESNPAGYRDYDVIKHLRNIVFRPRFVERKPVAVVDRRYEVRYSYRDEDLPGSIRQSAAADAAANADE